MVLRNKEDDTYDDSDDDDGPTEWMSREPCEECYEEIVDRLIHCYREKCSDDSRFFCLKIYHPLSIWSIECDNILSSLTCEYLVEWCHRKCHSTSYWNIQDITECRSFISNIFYLAKGIEGYLDIGTGIDTDASCSLIDYLDFWNVRDSYIVIFYLKQYS